MFLFFFWSLLNSPNQRERERKKGIYLPTKSKWHLCHRLWCCRRRMVLPSSRSLLTRTSTQNPCRWQRCFYIQPERKTSLACARAQKHHHNKRFCFHLNKVRQKERETDLAVNYVCARNCTRCGWTAVPRNHLEIYCKQTHELIDGNRRIALTFPKKIRKKKLLQRK